MKVERSRLGSFDLEPSQWAFVARVRDPALPLWLIPVLK